VVVLGLGLYFWSSGNRTPVAPPVDKAAADKAAADKAAADKATADKAAADKATADKAAADKAAADKAAADKAAADKAAADKAAADKAAADKAAADKAAADKAAEEKAAADKAAADKAAADKAAEEKAAADKAAADKAAADKAAADKDAADDDSGSKATGELAALKPGFSAEEVTAALNKSIVKFPSGRAEIPASMTPFLQKAAESLKQVPKGYVLEIAGYTDNTGDAQDNVALSQKRAEAVREAFVKDGVDPDMLVAKGYGSADPIASNETPEGRLRNRRIEYHVVKRP
jgi:outer membrane protein OmpA-like peptidoglycan-associated protein